MLLGLDVWVFVRLELQTYKKTRVTARHMTVKNAF